MQLENYGQLRKCEFPPGEEGPSFLVQATELVLRISQQMVTTAQLPWRRPPPHPPASSTRKGVSITNALSQFRGVTADPCFLLSLNPFRGSTSPRAALVKV